MYFCGIFSVTSNSRMMYAFSRDGAIPGSSFFAKVSTGWKSPIRTVWLACFLSFCLGLPSLGSSVAFSAATSIATIGLYISYGGFLFYIVSLWFHGRRDNVSSLCPFCRYTHSYQSHQPRQIRSRTVPSGEVFVSYRNRVGYVDYIYQYCVHLAGC
jgi:amino acid transporter